MLKKLYKYDWKSVSLLLLILHGVLLVYTLIGRIGMGFAMTEKFDVQLGTSASRFFEMASALYIMGYVLFIFAIMIATFVYLASRIQKSLFSDEGYLTHTLPVTPAKLLWSKIFIFWTWTVIDVVCVAASVFMLVTYKETLPSIGRFFQDVFRLATGYYGINDQIFMFLTLFAFIIEAFGFFTTLLLFSVCLGNLFKSHKVLGAVVSFFGINIGVSILNSLLLLLIPSLNPFAVTVTVSAEEATTVSGSTLGTPMMIFSIIWGLVFSIIFFLGSRYIMSKKLNLD